MFACGNMPQCMRVQSGALDAVEAGQRPDCCDQHAAGTGRVFRIRSHVLEVLQVSTQNVVYRGD